MKISEYIINKCAACEISVSKQQAEQFEAYHSLLISANERMNLTRVSEEISEACDRNYIDSLTLLKRLENANSVIDVGSGAGFPGIPLAIMRPDINFTLIDALGKRVEFLNSVIATLGLNARAIHIRSEEAAKQPSFRDSFDVACARAVSDMTVLSEWLLPFVKPGGRMLAMKGPTAEEEIEKAAFAIGELNGKFSAVYAADIRGRDWNHKIVEIIKLAPTPDRFPRKPGIAEKRPLIQK